MKFPFKVSLPAQIFVLVWVLVYLVAPWGFWFSHDFAFNGLDSRPYFFDAYKLAWLGFGAFCLGTLIGGKFFQKHSENGLDSIEPKAFDVAPILWVISLLLVTLTLLNYALTPIKWDKVLSPEAFGNQGLLFRRNLYSPWLEAFSDSFISLQILSLCYPIGPSKILGLWAFPSLLSAFTGWRYRLVLPVLAAWHNYVSIAGPVSKKAFVYTGLIVVFVCLLTMNRWALAHKDWGALTLNPKQLVTETPILNEFTQIKIFALLLKDRAENGEHYFSGCTFYKDVWVRIKPKSSFEGDKKPLSPWLIKVLEVTKSKNAKDGLPAPGMAEEYFFAFGPWGYPVLLFGLGLLLSIFPVYNKERPFCNAIGFNSGALVFQAITRGYTPQHIELAVFLAVPLILFYVLAKAPLVFLKR